MFLRQNMLILQRITLVHVITTLIGKVDRQSAVDLAQALLDNDLVIDPTTTGPSVFSKSVPFKLKQGAGKQSRYESLQLSGKDLVEEISETSSENDNVENDDLTAPEWLQNIEQRANIKTNLNDSRVELKPETGNLLKMSSPATHEDLSQFLNKFPSGIFKILALHLNA